MNVYRIENGITFGVNEVQIINIVVKGISELAKVEEMLATYGSDVTDMLTDTYANELNNRVDASQSRQTPSVFAGLFPGWFDVGTGFIDELVGVLIFAHFSECRSLKDKCLSLLERANRKRRDSIDSHFENALKKLVEEECPELLVEMVMRYRK